jgi:Regulator of ribonuclease activity B
LRVNEPGDVTFFLYFDTQEHTEHAHALLEADGFDVENIAQAYNPKEDPEWTVDVVRVLSPAGLDAAIARVREIAAASNGELDAVSMPWPGHPAAFASRRASRS